MSSAFRPACRRHLATLALAVSAAAGFAGAAGAQISLFRYNVPDLDQRRSTLPGDGDMHCVPTSAVNWMAYIANHGYAPMMLGARNWQDNANYPFVTQNINIMGAFMNTDHVDGTGGNEGNAGLQLFLLTRAPNLFTSTKWYGGITPFDVFVQMSTNGLVNVCYGYYKPFPNPFGGEFYSRDGGHCVTLNGIQNMFATSDPSFRMRDPASDADYFSQSTFATISSRVALQTFDSTPTPGGEVTRTRMLDFGTSSTTRRYLDSMYVIRANFSCWAPATVNPQIKISKVAALFGDPQPQETTINLAPGAIANAIALHPDLSKAVVVECTPGPVGTPATYRKKLINLADGSSTDLGLLLPAVQGKTPVVFDRFGRLIECDGSVLKSWDLSGRAPALVGSRVLASPASSIAYDDSGDEVVVLTPQNRRLIRCTPDLTGAIDEPLPAALPAMTDGSVLPDPATGKFIIAIAGSPTIHQIGLIPGTPRLALENGLLLPAVQSVQDLQPGDGGMNFALCDGSVRMLDRDPATGRLRVAPTQLYNNLPPMRSMTISRSRTNFDPELHSGPAWRNLANPDEGVVSTPDCPADHNLSGNVTIQDLFDFLADYFAQDPAADVNGSASLTVQDIFDFIKAYFRGC